MRKIFFISIALFTSLGINAITFDEAKKMVALKDGYIDFSPLNGELLTNEYLKNIFKFTNPESDTIKIVEEFFHRNPAGDLRTSDDTHFVNLLSPKGLGTLAAIIREYKNNGAARLTEKISTIFKSTSSDLFDQEFVEKKNKIWEEKNKERIKKEKKPTRNWIGSRLQDFNNALGSYIKNEGGDGFEFVKSLVLARAWKNPKVTEDVNSFFEGIEEELSRSTSEHISIREEMPEIAALSYNQLKENFLQSPETLLNKDRQALLFFSVSKFAKIPESIEYKEATVRGETFPNCGETSILGLFNFVRAHQLDGPEKFGDKEKNKEQLLKMFNISQEEFDEYLQTESRFPANDESQKEATRLAKFRAVDFFTKFSTTESQKKPEAHSAWANVISNLDGVEYRNYGNSNIAGEIAEEGKPIKSLNAIVKHLTGKETVEKFTEKINGLSYNEQAGGDSKKISLKSDSTMFTINVGEKHYKHSININLTGSVTIEQLFGQTDLKESKNLPFYLSRFISLTPFSRDAVTENQNLNHVISLIRSLPKNHDLIFKNFLFSSPSINDTAPITEFLLDSSSPNLLGLRKMDHPESYSQIVAHLLESTGTEFFTEKLTVELGKQIAHIVDKKNLLNFFATYVQVETPEQAISLVKKFLSKDELVAQFTNEVLLSYTMDFQKKFLPHIIGSFPTEEANEIKEKIETTTKTSPDYQIFMINNKDFEELLKDISEKIISNQMAEAKKSAPLKDSLPQQKIRDEQKERKQRIAEEKSAFGKLWGGLSGLVRGFFEPEEPTKKTTQRPAQQEQVARRAPSPQQPTLSPRNERTSPRQTTMTDQRPVSPIERRAVSPRAATPRTPHR